MAKNKTTETSSSVKDFINKVADETKRKDCIRIIELIQKQTGFEPKMWGASIIGFGNYHYKYASGHEGDAPLAAFSPRAAAIVLYLGGDYKEREELLQKLGKHKTSKGCVYIKKLDDVDAGVLIKMVAQTVKHYQKLYPAK